MKKNNPFLLSPHFKLYLWGGDKLKSAYNKETTNSTLSESWECSTHPDGTSMINSGEFDGKALSEVIKNNPHFLGEKYKGLTELPILIKFIDAKFDLSVQVHPDDEYANRNENGSLGKNEFWYVLEAEKNSKLVYGFKRNVSKQLLNNAIKKGVINSYLNNIKTKKGDCYFIKAGTVHAIGAGNLILEVQQNSNVTYRLFDYDRVDDNGNKRELHIDKSLDVINYTKTNNISNLKSVLYKTDYNIEQLCHNKYFIVDSIFIKNKYTYISNCDTFEVFICIEGQGIVTYDKEELNFKKGDTLFVPANSNNVIFKGNNKLIRVKCM